MEDARRVWIYRAVPDCLGDSRGPRDAASGMGSGRHGHIFPGEGALRGCNSLVLLALLYSWHAASRGCVRVEA